MTHSRVVALEQHADQPADEDVSDESSQASKFVDATQLNNDDTYDQGSS